MADNPLLSFIIIDDSTTMRRIIRACLAKIGYVNVAESGDGDDAFQQLQKIPYDVILTDWNMPNVDGLTLVKKIRLIPAYAKTPIIMITTEQNKEDVILAFKEGVSAYIIKPFTPEILKTKLEACFAKTKT